MPDDLAQKIFSGAGDSRLPSNVKPLSLEKRRQWVGAWNGRFRDCQSDGGATDTCETSAFRVANAAIKKEMLEEELAQFAKAMDELEAQKFYAGQVESWDVWSRALDQDEAEYNDRGGTDAQACSNCRWFVSPGACVIVEGFPLPIVSGGWSNRWEARKDAEGMDPIPVTIVDGEASLSAIDGLKQVADSLVKAVAGLISRENPKTGSAAALPEADPSRQFAFYKDTAGETRWIAWVTNKWRDRDNPAEIIEEKAHLDYVGWVDKTGNFPEAWLWHTPGTRWGIADMVDYTDGFLVASGVVDKGMESVAEALEGEDLGVSHGFRYRHSDQEQGIIGWYRSFELSPLPPDVAANQWTSFDMIGKEVEMAFNAAKREFLVGKIGEDRVALLENDTKGMRQALEKAGVESKEIEDALAADPPKDTKDAPAAVLSADQMKEISLATGKAAAEALLATEAFKGLVTATEEATAGVKTLTAAIEQANDDQKGIRDRLVELERTDDEKIASAIRGKSARPNGHVASADGKNVVKPGSPGDEEEFKGPSVLDNIMEGLEVEVETT